MEKIKILIAEDEKSTQKLYEKAFANENCELAMANDGDEAIKLYKSRNPDIVVLDIRMPVKTGYTALKEIREWLLDKKTTIIMATAVSDEKDVRDCLKCGIQGYIVKPFDSKTLAQKILEYHNSNKPEPVTA
jgi:two-component system sensor histidine kinase ChiS